MTRKILLLLGFFLISLFTYAQTDDDLALAAQFFQQENYAESIKLYQKQYHLTPSYGLYEQVLKCYTRMDDTKNAEKWILSAVKKNPTNLQYRIDLGDFYVRNDLKKKAEKQFEEILKSLPRSEHQIISLASSLSRLQHWDYAEKVYLRGRQIINDSTAFTFHLALLYEHQKNFDALVDNLFALLNKAPYYQGQIKVYLGSFLERNLDSDLALTLRKSLVRQVQKTPENKHFQDLLVWFFLQQNDYASAFRQMKAIDQRLPEENGQQLSNFAQTCLSAEAFDVAIEAFDILVAKGEENPFYLSSRIGLLDAKYLRLTKQLLVTEKEKQEIKESFEKAIEDLGKNDKTVSLIANYARLKAFYFNDLQGAVDALNEILDMPKLPAKQLSETKLELADILLLAGDIWEASLLYAQVEKAFKHDLLGTVARFKRAKLSYYIGEFGWAMYQLDVLRSSTSKLIANDAMELSLLISDNIDEDSTYIGLELFSKADLALYQKDITKAEHYLDSIEIFSPYHPLIDDVLMKRAEIRIKQKDYHAADSLLRRIVTFFPEGLLADDACFLLGNLNEDILKNIPEAILFYKTIVLEYSNSLLVTEARKRYKELSESLNSKKPTP